MGTRLKQSRTGRGYSVEKDDGLDAAEVRLDDPWYDALASGWGESGGAGAPAAVPAQTAPVQSSPAQDPPAQSGPVQPNPAQAASAPSSPGQAASGQPTPEQGRSAADIYLEVQSSAAFQEVRSRYRRFVVPAVCAFFVWYLAYVVMATAAPGFMARPVAGAVNVAMLAGLGQFLSTFLLTWGYTRHARLRRDRAALDLRWDTQELTRELTRGISR
ncbi:DUF485 domain-containing protein [Streptomyces sp. NPDC059398]|uniref:DUF485 domain-containing protein n=1 Tax=Streptomyces sp. NPDC059398 TaxID=3346820 RepID=UPI00369C7D1F